MPKARKSKAYSGGWPQERERRIATQFEQLLVEGHRCYSVAFNMSGSRVDCVKSQSKAMLRQIQSECEDSCCCPLQEDDVERPRMLAADKDDKHRKEADCADGHKPTAKKRPHPPLTTAKKRSQNQQLMPKHGHVAISIRTTNEASSSSSLAGELADIPIDELTPLEEIEEDLMETKASIKHALRWARW